MKRIVLLSCFAALALGQQHGRSERTAFDATAEKQWTEGNVLHMSGRVVIEADGFTLHASEVDFDKNSRELHPRGDVRISLK